VRRNSRLREQKRRGSPQTWRRGSVSAQKIARNRRLLRAWKPRPALRGRRGRSGDHGGARLPRWRWRSLPGPGLSISLPKRIQQRNRGRQPIQASSSSSLNSTGTWMHSPRAWKRGRRN